jgi:hypothetical protein
MKRYGCLLFVCLSGITATAQNIQLHYDTRNTAYGIGERNYFTSTVEMFKPDRWGSTFFFVDLDYKGDQGIGGAYWEVARDLKFWKAPVAIHLEYNGGIDDGYTLGNAYLLGAAYTWNNAQFSKGLSVSLNYKHIQKTIDDQPHSFQITAVWYLNFVKGLFSFTGFADFWREQSNFGTTIFLAEPQVWLNFNKLNGVPPDFKLSFGSEVELSHNFCGMDGFRAIPTIALKWSFN